MSGLKVFVDHFSQPCRAIMMLLGVNNVSHELVLIKIAQGEHLKEDFKKINPGCKLPAIDDNGFHLSESGAIMRYLCQMYSLPDHWYPSDNKKRAKIDEYLDWHHTNLRIGAARYVFESVLAPRMLGKEPNKEKVQELAKVLESSNKAMESYFLKDTKFINSDSISIADLQAISEYTQFWVSEQDPLASPRLAQWLEDCKAILQPHFDASHKMIYYARDKKLFKQKL